MKHSIILLTSVALMLCGACNDLLGIRSAELSRDEALDAGDASVDDAGAASQESGATDATASGPRAGPDAADDLGESLGPSAAPSQTSELWSADAASPDPDDSSSAAASSSDAGASPAAAGSSTAVGSSTAAGSSKAVGSSTAAGPTAAGSTAAGSTAAESSSLATETTSDSCGDGTVDGLEACDDGNRVELDGCSADCVTEQGWQFQSNGVLSPPFDPARTTYDVKLPLFVSVLTLSVRGPEGSQWAVEQSPLGAEGAWTSALLALGQTDIDVKVTNAEQASTTFRLHVHRELPSERYFKASNTGFGDTFGQSVALSGDGRILAVGAQSEDGTAGVSDGVTPEDGAADAGAVYLFEHAASGAWSQIAYLKGSSTAAGDLFGYAVGLSADGETLVIGAPGDDDSSREVGNGEHPNDFAPDSGAVYVFGRTAGGTWVQQAFIKASNADDGENFGRELSLSADGNVLAVSAPYEKGSVGGVATGKNTDNLVPGSGAAYIFSRQAGGAWSQQAYIKPAQPGQLDVFGESIALSADGDTLAVGAYWEDSSVGGIQGGPDGGAGADNGADISNAGAAFVFARSGVANWVQQAFIKPAYPVANGEFGKSISLSGDGRVLAVGGTKGGGAGAEPNDAGVSQGPPVASGVAYVFTRDGEQWSQQTYLKPSNPTNNDRFGFALSLAPNGAQLAIGAYAEDGSGVLVSDGSTINDAGYDSGAVYVFTYEQDWVQRGYVKATNTGDSDYFGWSVAFSADGLSLAVGARNENSGESGLLANPNNNASSLAGAAYVVQ